MKILKLGNVEFDWWITSQKVLSDMTFLHRIRTFPRDKVSNKTMKLIRANYLSKPEFDVENMRQVSAAAEGLCFWVNAIDIYNKIAKVVEPKKEKLKKAELMVKQHMKQLESRRKALQEVTEKLQKLSDQFSHMSQRKQDLQNQIQNCELKMTRAEKLLEALENERGRWDSNLKSLKLESEHYKWNALIGAVSVELLNNVDFDRRKKIISDIIKKFRLNIKQFSLKALLKHTSVLLADRNDRISEPYIILELTRKIPLIIDPQGESSRMLSNILSGTLNTIDINSTSLPTEIVSAIGNGDTLLIDNLREPFPLYLVQLIYPVFVKDGKETFLQLNNKLFHYNAKFGLILRTEKDASEFGKNLLRNFCIINVAVGENVIKNKLMEIFLQVNAFPLTSKRDQLIDEKTFLLRQSDAVEDGTLEALAKSKDLDDDRTIDLLGEVRGIAMNLEEKVRDLGEVEEQLEIVKAKFLGVGEFATKLVKTSVKVSKISPVYARTLRYYLEVFRKAVTMENTQLDETEISEINENVLRAFRKKISRSLFMEHRKIFEFLIQSHESLTSMTERQFVKLFSSLHAEKGANLRDQINHADSGMPIILLLSEESDYVIKLLFHLGEIYLPAHSTGKGTGKRRYVQLVSAKDLSNFEWNAILEKEQWLIFLNCENLNIEETETLMEVIEKIYSSDLRKANFRAFIILYPTNEMASHSLLDRSTVITVDDSQLTFPDFMRYAYISLGPSRIHANLKTNQQRQILYKLCCFHFAVFERAKYGIFGFANPFKISLSNFECAISLFETSLISVSAPTIEEIWKAIIEVAYFTPDSYDLESLKILAEWIFVGINKYDNQILNGIWLKNYSENFNLIRAQLDSLPENKNQALSGLSPAITKIYWQQELQKIYQNIIEFERGNSFHRESNELAAEALLSKPISYREGIGEIERCIVNEIQFLEENSVMPERRSKLQNLLVNPPIKRLTLYHFYRPEAIIETLKFVFSKRFKLPYDDIEVIGSLKKPTSDSLELLDCILIGAGFDPSTNSLIEPTKPFFKVPEIYIYSRRKVLKSATSFLFPLFYPSNLELSSWKQIVDVEIESNLPENHWILRGVKFITAENWQKLFPNHFSSV